VKRAFTGVAVIAALGMSSWLAYRAGQRHGASASPPTSSAPAAGASGAPNVRAQVREAIDDAGVTGRESLDRFLDVLEARARAQGKVTALEVEPGIAMIERHSSDPEEIARFSERMQRLQQELSAGTAKPDTAPNVALEAVLERAARAGGDAERQALVREYLEAVHRLPDAQQATAIERLNERLGAKAGVPDEATLDATYGAIERAHDAAARQELIREYLELLSELPDAARDERLARLNARFGADVPKSVTVGKR
jgi:hypothetical protein